MKRLLQEHILPLFIIVFLATGLTHKVTAGDCVSAGNCVLADIDKASFAGDSAKVEAIYKASEGRMKQVAGYRLLSLVMFVQQDMEAGKALLAELVSSLEKDLEENRRNGEGWALLASYRGMQIMNAPEFASIYAPKIGLEFALAEDYGKTTPTVFLIKGINVYNTPEQYGGSKERALGLFEKAVSLYEASEEAAHWGHMDVYAWRGQAYLAMGDKDKARADFERAIRYAPGNPWLQGLLASAG